MFTNETMLSRMRQQNCNSGEEEGSVETKIQRPMLNSYELCDGVHEVQAIIFTLHCIVVHR